MADTNANVTITLPLWRWLLLLGAMDKTANAGGWYDQLSGQIFKVIDGE